MTKSNEDIVLILSINLTSCIICRPYHILVYLFLQFQHKTYHISMLIPLGSTLFLYPIINGGARMAVDTCCCAIQGDSTHTMRGLHSLLYKATEDPFQRD